MGKMIDPQVLLAKLQVIGGGWKIDQNEEFFVACVKKAGNIELSVTCGSMAYEESPHFEDSFELGFSVMDDEAGDYIFDFDNNDVDVLVDKIKEFLESRIADFQSLIGNGQ